MKENKLNDLTVYIICKNTQIKKYSVNASRKFTIKDETYCIMNERCYKMIKDNKIHLFSVYLETNPKPCDLSNVEIINKGLGEMELDNLIAGDLYNILMECQRNTKNKYIFPICIACLVISIVEFGITMM